MPTRVDITSKYCNDVVYSSIISFGNFSSAAYIILVLALMVDTTTIRELIEEADGNSRVGTISLCRCSRKIIILLHYTICNMIQLYTTITIIIVPTDYSNNDRIRCLGRRPSIGIVAWKSFAPSAAIAAAREESACVFSGEDIVSRDIRPCPVNGEPTRYKTVRRSVTTYQSATDLQTSWWLAASKHTHKRTSTANENIMDRHQIVVSTYLILSSIVLLYFLFYRGSYFYYFTVW